MYFFLIIFFKQSVSLEKFILPRRNFISNMKVL